MLRYVITVEGEIEDGAVITLPICYISVIFMLHFCL